ncbi:MAG: phage BR0599 family protein, partial [Verrucomicrobia bacterium]|nr:phage BR0599 family protein [Verrucomicrobiota bacterium]
ALNLLSFFSQMGGEQNSFWLPANLAECRLTEDVLPTDDSLAVDNGLELGNNTFIALNDGINRAPLIVTGVQPDKIVLSGPVGQVFGANDTQVESLVLARFDALKLTLNFVHSQLARCQVRFKELPWETGAVAGETIGETMGSLPTTAMLYVFTETTPAGATTWRFTNFERDLSDGANEYTSAAMQNDAITDAPNLERQSVNIKSRNFAGNPMALLLPFQLEFPLTVAIYEADLAENEPGNVTNLRCYFSGEVSEIALDGPIITATCESLSWMFDRTAARRLYQNNDNWNLFEPANGLAASDWQWNATVVSYDAPTATLVIGAIAANNQGLNGATVLAAHYFAAGYAQITTGAATQYRMVGDSTAIAGGEITVSLAQALSTVPNVGDAVKIFAGYDGQYETAIGKFANGPKFGGFPFIPVGNPFVLKITQPAYGPGKK